MEYFRKQDAFISQMLELYLLGKIGKDFAPYMKWKMGKRLFSRAQAYAMMQVASTIQEKMFDDPNADKDILACIEGIDGELTSILPILP